MKIIIRTCCQTRKKQDRNMMFRVVKTKENKVFVDSTYHLEGFGAYVTKDRQIIEKAMLSNCLNRKLKTFISPDIYEEMLNQL